jgi:hypothetical protein
MPPYSSNQSISQLSVTRGFASEVHCLFDIWLQYGDYLYDRNPVEKVMFSMPRTLLSDWVEIWNGINGEIMYRLRGSRGTKTLSVPNASQMNPERIVTELCRLEWPGVEFAFIYRWGQDANYSPPASIIHEVHQQNAQIRAMDVEAAEAAVQSNSRGILRVRPRRGPRQYRNQEVPYYREME